MFPAKAITLVTTVGALLSGASAWAQAAPPFRSLKGNPAAGEKVFAQCRACHVTDKGVNRVGPSLHGIVGRKAGTVPGYNYSTANKNSGVTWTPEVLYVYLENPRKFMPGTKMAFAGLRNPQQRADVIAYLQQFR
ncbi:MAG: cytochrome c family protein [Sphingomonadaceae bacterium]|uniref:c-type cytochrome n=1 Tax=Thermaurantiacus sp. TaxID=2820283 RepID=UPI00298F0ED0|nr:cytochrome c family protein [Thermaurantiacus sp.]MCS6987791.1 cytochrome c family protein [Sphingomonadaceae bacterium]MDW8414989.1 cytochrome c family protein [Thermaurantiacus sp.]